jgi:phage terminase large subunit-like protein
MNVEFGAISAEAQTAHGFSPVVAILDEVGQVKGPTDAFIEAIETSQGAYDNPLLIAISTQAPTDGDLFSQWLDDARTADDPSVVSHVYAAPIDCDLGDREAWAAANPALGSFRSLEEVANYAEDAKRLPSKENSFRWLFLNQRIDASAPFIARTAWSECAGAVVSSFDGPVFAGLDLSSVSDLTAFVAMSPVGDEWHVKPRFWLPEEGLREKSRTDRVPYDVWARDGFLETTPGPSIDYRFVAGFLWDFCQDHEVRKIAFDRWGWRHLKPLLAEAGFSEAQLEGDAALFEPFGQGFQSMSPALLALEASILNRKIRHGGHPVLTMCAANATVKADPAGNRKLDKMKSHGRIDGMVALAMAQAMAGTFEASAPFDVMAMIA